MNPKIPKRFYAGSRPRRLRYPEPQIHACTCCGTHFHSPRPCPKGDGRRVVHRTEEFCSSACERYWPWIKPSQEEDTVAA